MGLGFPYLDLCSCCLFIDTRCRLIFCCVNPQVLINVLKLYLYSVVSVIFVFNHIWDDDPNLFCSCLGVWTTPTCSPLLLRKWICLRDGWRPLYIYIHCNIPTCCCPNHSLPAIHSCLVKCQMLAKDPIYNMHVNYVLLLVENINYMLLAQILLYSILVLQLYVFCIVLDGFCGYSSSTLFVYLEVQFQLQVDIVKIGLGAPHPNLWGWNSHCTHLKVSSGLHPHVIPSPVHTKLVDVRNEPT